MGNANRYRRRKYARWVVSHHVEMEKKEHSNLFSTDSINVDNQFIVQVQLVIQTTGTS